MSSGLSTELTMNSLVRPAIAGALASGFLYYRNGYKMLDYKIAGLVTGSVLVGDMFGNVVFKRVGLQATENAGLKSFEHMITAPLLSGGVFAGAYKMIYSWDKTTPIYKLVALAATADAVSEKISTPFAHMLQPDAVDEF
jgi:hypothetical protein